MKLIAHIIEKFVGKIKRDPAYKLNSEYSGRQVVYIILYRVLQILRGFKIKVIFQKAEGVVFCGRSVKIEHGYMIQSENGLIIDDHVFINGLSEKGISFGRNVTIARDSIFVCTGVLSNKGTGITIGDNSAIGAQSFLGGQGGIDIGSDVIMGPGVKIFSENHNYSAEGIIRKQGENRKGVIIEDNCWIGANTVILDGVHISNGCVVAAGSVVTKSIPCNSIIAGIPAKVIKNRISEK